MTLNKSRKLDESELIETKRALLTIKNAYREGDGEIVVECLCDCGNTWKGYYKSLGISGRRSCGCLNHSSKHYWRKAPILYGSKKFERSKK